MIRRRVKILQALSDKSPSFSEEIAKATGYELDHISRSLGHMYNEGLVEGYTHEPVYPPGGPPVIPRVFWSITDKGRKALRNEEIHWETLLGRLKRFLGFL